MQLSNILQGFEYTRHSGTIDQEITAISFDSRTVETGNLFVATRGTAVDGHEYIDQAIEKGATAIVCEELPSTISDTVTYLIVSNSNYALGIIACNWYGNPSRQLHLVGVTGTNGKTTIATLLYQLTKKLGHKVGLLSTVCNYVDNTAIAATHTTPDALHLNALLRQMVDQGCRYAFMEVSSHAADQDRIAGLHFDGGIFTNLTRDHIDYHKTFTNYLNAKRKFFEILGKDAFAITNIDDKNGLIITQTTKALVLTYSTRMPANFKGKIIEESFDGMLLNICQKEVFTSLVGAFNLSNILAIYGAACSLGFDPDEVLRLLSTLTAVSGRFQTIHSAKGWTAIVDYAHTPDAVVNVINTINAVRKSGMLTTIIGCGGNRDKGKRPIMAQQAYEKSDRLIITSDNPRQEDPQDIINDMLAGLTAEQQQQTIVIPDRHEAIKMACHTAQKSDVILVAGKGHENYQIIGTTKHHFDDVEEVKKYI